MRVLFVGINIVYSNPSKALMLPLLKGAFETDFYGLGFVSSEQLEKGILNFEEANGPYDLIVWDNYIGFFHEKKKFSEILIKHLSKGLNNLSFETKLVPGFIDDLYDNLRSISSKVIHSFLQTDLYHFEEDFTDYLSQTDHYYMVCGGEVPVLKEKNPNLLKEGFHERAKDHWHYFCEEHAGRLIPIPHWIAESEFSWTPLSDRKFVATVPGTGYYRREVAANFLKASKEEQPSYLIPKLIQFCNRQFFSRFNLNDPLIQIRNSSFMNSISNTKYAYTEGSYLDFSVRKFFEIPALGTLLMCSPSIAYEDLGFKDTINSIVVEPEEFVDAIKDLENDPLRAQNIADKGRQLIFDKHSLRARCSDLGMAFESIQCGRYYGADWRDGTLKINSKT